MDNILIGFNKKIISISVIFKQLGSFATNQKKTHFKLMFITYFAINIENEKIFNAINITILENGLSVEYLIRPISEKSSEGIYFTSAHIYIS